MAALRITQVRSSNGADPKQRAALRTLGLGHICSSSECPDDATVTGVLRQVEHLVRVER
jgi:large subunit ribosomal protein L30